MIGSVKTQFTLAFQMLEELIDGDNKDIWDKKVGGYVYFQQLLHTLMGTHFWFRDDHQPFKEPFQEYYYYPELEHDPEQVMAKKELIIYKEEVKKIVNHYFDSKDDTWLAQSAKVYPKLTNLEIIFMQIRHVMYHVGYANAVLKELKKETVKWIDYYG